MKAKSAEKQVSKEDRLLEIEQAIIENNVQVVKDILNEGLVKPNDVIEDKGIETPLLAIALKYARNETALELIKAGANVNTKIKTVFEGGSGLLLVCISKKIDKKVFLELFKQGVDPNKVLKSSDSYFDLSIRLWHFFCVIRHKSAIAAFFEFYGPSLLVGLPNASNLSILNLLQPNPCLEIQYLFKDSLAIYERSKNFLEADKSNAVEEILDGLVWKRADRQIDGIVGEVQEQYYLLRAKGVKIDEGLTIKMRAIMEVAENIKGELFLQMKEDLSESFREGVDNLVSAILEIHLTYKALFKGENEGHKEICKLIEKMQEQLQQPKSSKEEVLGIPKEKSPLLSTKNNFCPKTEIRFFGPQPHPKADKDETSKSLSAGTTHRSFSI